MLSLHTNYASLSTQNALGATQKTLTTSMSRLGTGFRINSAMDDAAGLQIATRMNAQSRGMAVAMRNTQNGISMMQTAEGAFKEMTNIVTRMKDLSKDGTAGKLGAAAVTFQIGATTAETMDVDVTTALGDLGTDLDAVVASYTAGVTAGTPGTEIATAAAANTAIDDLADVLDSIGAVRAQLGASSNRLESVYNNLGNQRTQTDASKGRIMDVDYAAETANMTKNQMLMQASTSMLKQSSSMSQLVMSLMQ
jgi:flagellin